MPGACTRPRKIAHVAEAGHRPCMMGCMSESCLGITAAAHFASAHPVIEFFDLDSRREHAANPIVGGVTYQGGVMTLPDAPGLGACPDPGYLRTLERLA